MRVPGSRSMRDAPAAADHCAILARCWFCTKIKNCSSCRVTNLLLRQGECEIRDRSIWSFREGWSGRTRRGRCVVGRVLLGYRSCLPSYSTAYRSALRTTRTQLGTRSVGSSFGYGCFVSPYGTSYRSTLRTTRSRLGTRSVRSFFGYGYYVPPYALPTVAFSALPVPGLVPGAPAAADHCAISSVEICRPGTFSGTGASYHPTALPTVAPYALPVPGLVPGAPAAADHCAISSVETWSAHDTMMRFLVKDEGLRVEG